MLALCLALALGSEPVEVVRSGPVRERVVHDDADLVIFYVGEHRGRLGSCGCEVNPRGGLARLDGYLQAVRRHGPGTPAILVHTGWWVDDRIDTSGALRPDAVVADRGFLAGVEAVGFDALNTSFRDTAWMLDHPPPALALSANAGGGLAGHRVIRVGDLEVALIGVSRAGAALVQPEGVDWTDPVAAVQARLAQVGPVDLGVVLAYDVGERTREIARLEGVDVLIEAGGIAGKLPPWFEGGTVWVQSRDEGQAVGELRLWLDEDGRIARVRDRWVDLDPLVPATPALRRLERQVDRERREALRRAGLAE